MSTDPTLIDALQNVVRHAPHIFGTDFLRYVLGAGGVFLVVNVGLSGLLAERRLGDRTPQRGQVRREILSSLRTVGVFATLGGCGVIILITFGLDRIYDDPAAYGWGYFALSLVAATVLHDAWFYWTHRLIHDRRLFRRVHRLHHRSKKPTPFTSYAFNTGEAALNAVFMPLLVATVPLSGLAIFLFLAHMMVRNAIGHCGYELFPARRDGRPLLDWVTTVTHHDMHHTDGRYNFGLYFSWWDRWMGTEHPDYHARFAKAVGRWLEPARPRRAPVATASLLALAIGFSAAKARATEMGDDPITQISGLWVSEGAGAVIRLGACDDDNALCGWLDWSWDPDIAEADGAAMLEGFSWREGAFRGGRLTNPETGRTYRGAIRPDGDILRLKGCAGPFCAKQIWRRLEDGSRCVTAAKPA